MVGRRRSHSPHPFLQLEHSAESSSLYPLGCHLAARYHAQEEAKARNPRPERFAAARRTTCAQIFHDAQDLFIPEHKLVRKS